MDDALRELLVGLTCNGLSELISRGSEQDKPVSSDVIEAAVSTAIFELTDAEAIFPRLGGEQLRDFLRSAEASNVVRQIFASTHTPHINEIEQEFYQLWHARMGVSTGALKADIDRLFRSLVKLCQKSLDIAIAAGSLTAHEARAAQRHAELRGSVASIERTLSVLSTAPQLNLGDIDDYSSKYRRQLAAREGSITPPALDSARQIPIDSLYVPARLEQLEVKDRMAVSYDQFARTLFRRVVLGNPGSGKSTLAKKLATDIARDKLAVGHQKKGAVPFLVVLRDFGARKKDSPCSIVDFIVSTSNSRYQVQVPPAAIEYLLLTNRAVVIFDGLDELLDTTYRSEISGDVESFANLYPSVPLIVTSREVGYPQAPLSPATFTAFRLAPFSESEVRQYARNWFAVDDKGLPGEADDQASEFMKDSASVSDLRSNALMLGLMCNLYKGSGYIPRNRPDVYEACAEMLFDRWDRLRQIGKPLSIESLLRPTMQHLAAWIYADGDLQSGVTERDLIATASAFLLDRRFEKADEAELEARRFIEFCRGRAWVFTDTGTTAAGDRLYQFTHRTFLEFFTAGHLVRTNPSPDKLLAVLEPHISAREWDVVAQLAFQLLEHNVDGAADDLLSELSTGDIHPRDGGQANRLNFAARSLEFLVPSPAITRALVSKVIDRLMEAVKARSEVGRVGKGSGPMDTVGALLTINPENVTPVRDVLIEKLGQYMSQPSTGLYAAELSLHIDLSLELRQRPVDRQIVDEIAERALADYGPRLRDLARSDWKISSDLVVANALELREHLGDHPLGSCFCERSYELFPGTQRVSLVEMVIANILWEYHDKFRLESSLECLSALAPHLTPQELSSVSYGRVYGSWLSAMPSGNRLSRNVTLSDLSGDQRYSFLILLAIIYEDSLSKERSAPFESDSSLMGAMAPILLARADMESAETLESSLETLGLTAIQAGTAKSWAEGSLSLRSSRKPGR